MYQKPTIKSTEVRFSPCGCNHNCSCSKNWTPQEQNCAFIGAWYPPCPSC